MNHHLTIILAALSVASAAPSLMPRRLEGRIIGGEDTTINQVPWQVSIQAYGRHYCGGSIINSRWILTAGHCADLPQYVYTIRAGSSDNFRGGRVYQIDRMLVHEDYREEWGFPTTDMALMRVSEPFEFGEACQAVEMFEANERAEVGAMSTITGWGSTGKLFGPATLQRVAVPIISIEQCRWNYREVFEIPDNGVVCASTPEGGKDACQGDSGGPMVVDDRLAGIVSWGLGCGDAGNPGVYTEVAHFRDWILQRAGV